MATKKTNKRKAKRTARTKPLTANLAHRRTRSSPAKPAPGAHPAMLPSFGVLDAYAELPARLLTCRSPLQLWAEYMRFGQRLMGGFMQMSVPSSRTIPR